MRTVGTWNMLMESAPLLLLVPVAPRTPIPRIRTIICPAISVPGNTDISPPIDNSLLNPVLYSWDRPFAPHLTPSQDRRARNVNPPPSSIPPFQMLLVWTFL
ncbi:hypothetical protein M413DRAFT_128507 [Hebeloma cylindrosporum]|uniref:Uncharacterized protein n=1 Tax=Hebeloma cylindrosporum TaxID=76867 RepID=A0A0C2XX01_HEBCY|nr:hypothetical protein M413DRAFT_128507 [Hebeloma cylindrosporum h7]